MRGDPVRIAFRVFVVVTVVGFAAFFFLYVREYAKGEARQAAFREELRSGKHHFGDQPALFAVAQAVVNNDGQAIRTAASAVPDLQTPGRDGQTLLYFAITSSWPRAELSEAVRTLLALGADPNHTNGQRGSFAMAAAGHASPDVLRAMLDAGGDPNTRDEHGWPMILRIWYLGYYAAPEERAKLELLLERGADINSTAPDRDIEEAGYPLLLYRMTAGPKEDAAYADALYLLQRGADPNRPGRDGITFAKMLMQHREQLPRNKTAPPGFQALWDWAKANGFVQ